MIIMPKGKLIVFDGIDGAGSETQSRLLSEFLAEKGMQCLVVNYPDYQNPIGNFIHNYLNGSDHIPVAVRLVLYTADMLKDKEGVEQALSDGKIVIANRYVTTALAYQVVEGFDAQKALEYLKVMGFPVPDIAVYLKIKPETSKKRKLKEKGRLDRIESDLQLLAKVGARYEEMAEKDVFCRWVVVDGEKPISKVFEDVKRVLGF
ncbi:MAG: dTMP kinase [Candidatus Aenigmarchaeota archaeon]|nr:dTMP kinase [Candidatus Aenigmarchaeota archaeon]